MHTIQWILASKNKTENRYWHRQELNYKKKPPCNPLHPTFSFARWNDDPMMGLMISLTLPGLAPRPGVSENTYNKNQNL